jgi:release factor glutamine methyltransferase
MTCYPPATPKPIAEAIRDAAARLSGIAENPRREARLLLAHALGLTQNDLIRDPSRRVDVTLFNDVLDRRVAREPLALIVGHQEFWSMRFEVSAATLIPRADSETLIEAALAAFADRPPPHKLLDLGTGTGCLLLALLKEFPSAFGIGLDLGPDAAALAKRNAAHNGLTDRSAFVAGDWTSPLSGRFDLIISNPPYIPAPAIDTQMPEVARYEPRRALDGGRDGYEAYRKILPNLGRHLEPDGKAVLELGIGQANYVTDLARESGLDALIRRDLTQVPRAITLTRLDR